MLGLVFVELILDFVYGFLRASECLGRPNLLGIGVIEFQRVMMCLEVPGGCPFQQML
jgi:hypothetical protein